MGILYWFETLAELDAKRDEHGNLPMLMAQDAVWAKRALRRWQDENTNYLIFTVEGDTIVPVRVVSHEELISMLPDLGKCSKRELASKPIVVGENLYASIVPWAGLGI